MNCFMGYNPLVAKEVKITTWIKEFDGESPVYPSFPNDGDCFVVFATDEDALTHNALSKKTYTNGDWADAEGGGGGGGSSDFSTAEVTFTYNGDAISGIELHSCYVYEEDDDLTTFFLVQPSSTERAIVVLYKQEAQIDITNLDEVLEHVTFSTTGGVTWDDDDEYFTVTGDGTVTITDK